MIVTLVTEVSYVGQEGEEKVPLNVWCEKDVVSGVATEYNQKKWGVVKSLR